MASCTGRRKSVLLDMQKIVRDWQQDLGMVVVSKIKDQERSRVAIDPGFKLLLVRKLASPSSPEIATSAAAADKHGIGRDN